MPTTITTPDREVAASTNLEPVAVPDQEPQAPSQQAVVVAEEEAVEVDPSEKAKSAGPDGVEIDLETLQVWDRPPQSGPTKILLARKFDCG